MSYPVNYFQVQVQQVLKDGRTFGIFLGDGIGSSISDKVSSEDFVTLDGKVIKMDLTKLVEMDSQDIMAPNKHIYTDETNSVFHNYCDLVYEPKWQ